MALELVVKLDKRLPIQKGTSARGEWSKQDFVVETQDTYPKKICMNVWGDDKILELNSCKDGEQIKVSFNIESREYNQRWYTDIRAWKIEKLSNINSTKEDNFASVPVPENKPLINVSDIGDDDDLPF